MKKKIYLAGMITGVPAEQAENKFKNKQRELEQKGYAVFNPVEFAQELSRAAEVVEKDPIIKMIASHLVPPHLYEALTKGCSWELKMKRKIRQLMEVDELHLLSCWNESKGATMLRDLAMRLQIPIVYH